MTGKPAPRRAKLELLVRKPDADGEGFEVQQVGSALAFVQSGRSGWSRRPSSSPRSPPG